MNRLINTIRIAGFRGIKNREVSLPRITVLLGTKSRQSLTETSSLLFVNGIINAVFSLYAERRSKP